MFTPHVFDDECQEGIDDNGLPYVANSFHEETGILGEGHAQSRCKGKDGTHDEDAEHMRLKVRPRVVEKVQSHVPCGDEGYEDEATPGEQLWTGTINPELTLGNNCVCAHVWSGTNIRGIPQ